MLCGGKSYPFQILSFIYPISIIQTKSKTSIYRSK